MYFKEVPSSLVLDFHNVGGLTRDRLKIERSKLILQKPRYPDFQSEVLVKLQKR